MTSRPLTLIRIQHKLDMLAGEIAVLTGLLDNATSQQARAKYHRAIDARERQASALRDHPNWTPELPLDLPRVNLTREGGGRRTVPLTK